MSESNYTQGPWRIADPDPRCGSNLNILGPCVGHSAAFVAVVRCSPIGHTTAGDWLSPDRQMAQANARLIAAAPDLLAALKEVVAIADRKTDAFDRARAAIARAECSCNGWCDCKHGSSVEASI